MSDKELEKCLQGHGGFRVPDGYFDTLTDKVMARLPEQQPVQLHVEHRRWRLRRPAILAAASVIAAMFSIGVVMHQNKNHADALQMQAQTAVASEVSTTKAIDQIANYSMMDNDDMYAYMAENY